MPDDIKPNAKVRIVAQNPGEAEVLGRRFFRWYKGEEGTGEIWETDVPRPLIGKSGYELDHKFLPLAGLTRDDVECTNVIRCRLNNSNDLPALTTTMARDMVTHCQRAYWREPREGQTLVALGAFALWALTGEYEGDDDDADHADDDVRASKSVDGWRGWLLDYKPQHSVDSRMAGGRGYVHLEQSSTDSSDRGQHDGLGRSVKSIADHGGQPESAQGERSGLQVDSSPDGSGSERSRLDDDGVSVHEHEAQRTDTLRVGPVESNQDAKELCSQRVVVRDRRDQAPTKGIKVFCTYHPAFFWRAHWMRPVGKMDFARLGRLLRGTWPEPFPHIAQSIPRVPQRSLAFDTEYNPWTKELHRYSLGWRNADDVPTIHVVEAADMLHHAGRPEHAVMQNAEADWPYITSVFGALPETWDDTMFAHSVLYGTLRHSLDFMGSCYARHNRWKHLQQSDPLTYSGMDALATFDIWQQLSRELDRDRLSRELYEHELKPLLPHVMARPPVRLNAMHIAEAAQELEREQQQIAKRGEAVAGWPLNVSSADQVSRWLRLKSDLA